jgi:hypothetical protein
MEKIKKVRNIVVTITAIVFSIYVINGFLKLKDKKNQNPIVNIESIPDEYAELFKDINLCKLKSSYIFKNRAPITVLTYKDYSIVLTKVICNSNINSDFIEIKKQKISDSNQGVYMPFTENRLTINYNLESGDDASIIKLKYDGTLTSIPSSTNFFIFNVSLGGFSIALDNNRLKEIYCKNASISNTDSLANLLFIKKGLDLYIIIVSGSIGPVLSKEELSYLFVDIAN